MRGWGPSAHLFNSLKVEFKNRSNRRKEAADPFEALAADQQPPYVGCYDFGRPETSVGLGRPFGIVGVLSAD
jgi:hypothetical protein